MTRRGFGRRALAGALLARARPVRPDSTPIARFLGGLDDDWRGRLCLPFDHPSRTLAAENWAVVEPSIGDLPSLPRALCREILLGLGDAGWRRRLFRVMDGDSGGLDSYHVALFGRPDRPGRCEFVLTGRHLTLRADGHRPGQFSRIGPMLYGHAATRDNAWQFQDDQARGLFRSLDDRRREQAFSDVGISAGELGPDQAARFQGLLATLAPWAEADPMSSIHYHRGDSGSGFASIWKVQGGGTSWSFHGVPHVHARLEFA